MILATFGPSSPHAGKQIVWQDGHMLVDGLPLTFQQVFDFDARGELAWSYDGLQQWMSQLVQHQDAAAASSVAPGESPAAGTATTLVAMHLAPAPTQAPNLSPVPAGEYDAARQLAERGRTTPRDKSVAAALVLTFLFGPLGLFYCVAWWAALLMFVGAVVIALPTLGIGAALFWVASMVWGAVAASKQHSAFQVWIAQQPQTFIPLPPQA
jgi:hypothetical protein